MRLRLMVLIVLAHTLASCTASTTAPRSRSVTPTPTSEPRRILATAPESFLRDCRETARVVGYPIPCPRLILSGGTPPPSTSSCSIGLIGPAACHPSWRGWVVGSMETGDHHLFLQAAPRAIRSLARAVDGPGWYPGARVRMIRSFRVRGWRIREVAVPLATNEGSAFARHQVLVWTLDGHTCAVGFHRVGSLRRTRMLNERVVRSIRLIAPPTG
jgi:hypothetical protein